MDEIAESEQPDRKRRKVLTRLEIRSMLRDHEIFRRSVKETLKAYDISESSFHNKLAARAKYLDIDQTSPQKNERNRISPLVKMDNALTEWIRSHRNPERLSNKSFRNLARRECAFILTQFKARKIHLPENVAKHFERFKASEKWAWEWKKKRKESQKKPSTVSEGSKLLLGFHEAVKLQALVSGKNPKWWCIKAEQIREEEGRSLARALEKDSSKCEMLTLFGNKMSYGTFLDIYKAIMTEKNQKKIRHLAIRENSVIQGKGVELISKMTHLTHLHLWDCKLGEKDAKNLAKLLQTTTCLEELILTRNFFGPKGADVIGEALKHNKTVKVLSMDSNYLGGGRCSEPPRVFLEMLTINCTIERLHLDMNWLGDEVCQSILANKNSVIYDLRIKHNGITNEGVKDLATLIRRDGNRVRSINLKDNYIGDDGAIALTEAIRKRSSPMDMFDLGISEDYLTPSGVKKVREAVKEMVFLPSEFDSHDCSAVSVSLLEQYLPL